MAGNARFIGEVSCFFVAYDETPPSRAAGSSFFPAPEASGTVLDDSLRHTCKGHDQGMQHETARFQVSVADGGAGALRDVRSRMRVIG
jgi:hypothetical protein